MEMENVMNPLDPQASELNQMLADHCPTVTALLSNRGRAIFFPSKGLVAQGMEAKDSAINATIGVAYRDDRTPLRLSNIESVIDLPPEKVFPYSNSYGNRELRLLWLELMGQKNASLDIKKISRPIVTSALTHGLSMTGYLFVDEGDSIILPDLFWGNYKLIYQNTYGGQLVTYPFFKNQKLNVDGFARCLKGFKSEKKIVLLNFPNNPTGYTPSDNEAEEITNILVAEAESGSRLLVVFDDAYFGLVYQEGVFRQSLFAQLAQAHENILAVKVDGATKEDYVWGFRVGFVTFGIKGAGRAMYEALEQKCAGAVRATISNASNLSQSLLLQAYQSATYQQEKMERYQLLKTRYETVTAILEDHDEFSRFFTALPYNSGYFMCVRLKDGLDAEEIRQHLLKKYQTGVIALKQHNLIRVAFASTPTHRLEQLFLNLYSACRDLG